MNNREQPLLVDRAARTTARINALVAGILDLPTFRESDEYLQLVSEYLQVSDTDTPASYTEVSRQEHSLYERIRSTLPGEHRDLIGEYSDTASSLAWAETMAAFDLGRRTEAAIANRTRRPPLERMFDVLQFTVGQAEPDVAQRYRRRIEYLQAAIPVARAIILTGEAIAPDADALDDYLRAERARVMAQPEDPTDPEHECALAAVSENAVFYVALTLGLFLSEAV